MKQAYAALGDGLSVLAADHPEARGAAPLLWRNDGARFLDFQEKDLHSRQRGWEDCIFARPGATLADVEGEQVESLAKTGMLPAIVTLTIGWHDVLALAGTGRTEGETAARGFAERLVTLIDRLRKLGGDGVTVLVTTVIDPSDETGDITGLGVDYWPAGSEVLAVYNGLIRAVCALREVTLIDAHDHFLGHGEEHANPSNRHYDPRDPTPWTQMLAEPTARGAHELRKLWWNALAPAMG